MFGKLTQMLQQPCQQLNVNDVKGDVVGRQTALG